jgi:hypothetical protein
MYSTVAGATVSPTRVTVTEARASDSAASNCVAANSMVLGPGAAVQSAAGVWLLRGFAAATRRSRALVLKSSQPPRSRTSAVVGSEGAGAGAPPS